MHPNHEYLLDFIARTHPQPRVGRFLDYGCGSGQVVVEGRNRGLEFFGADVFYSASRAREEVIQRGLFGNIVREIQNDHLDFPDDYFDIVVNNQVFEHVENIDRALLELVRVMKENGILLCVFPAKEIIIEPHWGIPLAHWFPKQSQIRLYYVWFCRSIGFGYRKKDKSKYEWAANVCQWIDGYTFYKTGKEIDNIFNKVFITNDHIEDDYILFRLKDLHSFAFVIRLLFKNKSIRLIVKRFSRRYGSVVMKAMKVC